MSRNKNLKRTFTIYSVFLAACSILSLGMMLSSPSEPGNTVLLGLSSVRLLLALVLFMAFVLFVGLAIKTFRDRAWAEKKIEGWFGRSHINRKLVWLSWISFGLGWTGIFLPSYRVGWLENYWLRIQPVMLFILLAGFATLMLLYIQRRESALFSKSNSKTIRLSAILFLVSLIVLTGILTSGFGIRSLDDFWYGAGVPILVPQIIGAVAGGTFLLKIEKKSNFKRLDFFVFVLIFFVTAFLWAREPLQKGFSFIDYPPNYDLYPLYDAAFFDTGSQFALIGQKIFMYGGYFFERPLYSGFLVYLHALFGQDYAILMAGQAAVYAVFPALIYLIGRSLNLRAVGLAAALVAAFRGINAIAASNMIDLASPKMMLTDFPAAIGVALVVLAVCEWLKQPAGNWQYALWVGGAVGFTLMLRTNALMLLALIPVYGLFKFSKEWKIWMLHSSLLLLAVISITLPWELRNRSLGGPMYGSIVTKFRAVITQRYITPTPAPTPQVPVTQSLLVLSTLYQGDDPAQNDPACDAVACFVPNHFLHNIITSVLILPTSPVMDDLRHTVRDNYPYWYPQWDGTFTILTLAWFIINLLLITLGISVAWNQRHLPGLAPLAIFLFYNLSNAFARTSGGRYVVPMDWIITLYFLLGIFQVIVWVARSINMEWSLGHDPIEQETDRGKSTPNIFPKAAFVLFILLGFGSLLPLSENLFSERYQNFDSGQALAQNKQVLESAGLDIPSIEAFLLNKQAEILVGRALYPRYFLADQQEAVFFPSLPLLYPRTTFDLIGPEGQRSVVLPGNAPQHLPHASDVLVIGCREQYYFDALAVLILDETGVLYTRLPESELRCPLQQPVCDNGSVCK